MVLVVAAVVGWLVLSALGVAGAAAVCRAGHVEDVARGFVEPDGRPAGPPSPRGAPQVTAR